MADHSSSSSSSCLLPGWPASDISTGSSSTFGQVKRIDKELVVNGDGQDMARPIMVTSSDDVVTRTKAQFVPTKLPPVSIGRTVDLHAVHGDDAKLQINGAVEPTQFDGLQHHGSDPTLRWPVRHIGGSDVAHNTHSQFDVKLLDSGMSAINLDLPEANRQITNTRLSSDVDTVIDDHTIDDQVAHRGIDRLTRNLWTIPHRGDGVVVEQSNVDTVHSDPTFGWPMSQIGKRYAGFRAKRDRSDSFVGINSGWDEMHRTVTISTNEDVVPRLGVKSIHAHPGQAKAPGSVRDNLIAILKHAPTSHVGSDTDWQLPEANADLIVVKSHSDPTFGWPVSNVGSRSDGIAGRRSFAVNAPATLDAKGMHDIVDTHQTHDRAWCTSAIDNTDEVDTGQGDVPTSSQGIAPVGQVIDVTATGHAHGDNRLTTDIGDGIDEVGGDVGMGGHFGHRSGLGDLGLTWRTWRPGGEIDAGDAGNEWRIAVTRVGVTEGASKHAAAIQVSSAGIAEDMDKPTRFAIRRSGFVDGEHVVTGCFDHAVTDQDATPVSEGVKRSGRKSYRQGVGGWIIPATDCPIGLDLPEEDVVSMWNVVGHSGRVASQSSLGLGRPGGQIGHGSSSSEQVLGDDKLIAISDNAVDVHPATMTTIVGTQTETPDTRSTDTVVGKTIDEEIMGGRWTDRSKVNAPGIDAASNVAVINHVGREDVLSDTPEFIGTGVIGIGHRHGLAYRQDRQVRQVNQAAFIPGPRAERRGDWGRGLYNTQTNQLVTWPEEDAEHDEVRARYPGWFDQPVVPMHIAPTGHWTLAEDGWNDQYDHLHQAISAIDPRLKATGERYSKAPNPSIPPIPPNPSPDPPEDAPLRHEPQTGRLDAALRAARTILSSASLSHPCSVELPQPRSDHPSIAPYRQVEWPWSTPHTSGEWPSDITSPSTSHGSTHSTASRSDLTYPSEYGMRAPLSGHKRVHLCSGKPNLGSFMSSCDAKWDFNGSHVSMLKHASPEQGGPDYYHLAPTTERARIQQHGLQPSRPANNDRWNDWETWRPKWLRNQPEGVYVVGDPKRTWNWSDASDAQADQPVPGWDMWHVPQEQINEIHPDPAVNREGQPQGAWIIPHAVQPQLYQGGPETSDWEQFGKQSASVPSVPSVPPQWQNVRTDNAMGRLLDRRPVIYHHPSNMLYAGGHGSTHSDLLGRLDIPGNIAMGWMGPNPDAYPTDAVYRRGEPNEVGWYPKGMSDEIIHPSYGAHQLMMEMANNHAREGSVHRVSTKMSAFITPWEPGSWGKGIVSPMGGPVTWKVNPRDESPESQFEFDTDPYGEGYPSHGDVEQKLHYPGTTFTDARGYAYIKPNGQVEWIHASPKHERPDTIRQLMNAHPDLWASRPEMQGVDFSQLKDPAQGLDDPEQFG